MFDVELLMLYLAHTLCSSVSAGPDDLHIRWLARHTFNLLLLPVEGQYPTLHKTRSSSCQPYSQPNYSSAADQAKPQPSRTTESGSPQPSIPATINSRFRTASFAASIGSEASEIYSHSRQPLPRKASVSMRARSRDTSRVTSHIVASVALPNSLLQGGFPKSVSNRSCLKQYDVSSAALRKTMRVHRGNSRQGSGFTDAHAAATAPALTDLVNRPRQAAGKSSPALR